MTDTEQLWTILSVYLFVVVAIVTSTVVYFNRSRRNFSRALRRMTDDR
jgi:hypothetical protein